MPTDQRYERPDYMDKSPISRTANEMREKPQSTRERPFLKKSEIEWRWIEERNHANAYIKHPATTVIAILEEVPPGGKPTSLHRHAVEAVYYILQGKGKSLVGDKYYEWEPGDSFYVEAFAWHQHWCFSEEPARFLACTNGMLMNHLDMHLYEERGVHTKWEDEHDAQGKLKVTSIIDERY